MAFLFTFSIIISLYHIMHFSYFPSQHIVSGAPCHFPEDILPEDLSTHLPAPLCTDCFSGLLHSCFPHCIPGRRFLFSESRVVFLLLGLSFLLVEHILRSNYILTTKILSCSPVALFPNNLLYIFHCTVPYNSINENFSFKF